MTNGIPQSARNQIFSEVTKYHVEENQSQYSALPLQEVSRISKGHSAAMESFYLSSNVKVFVGVNTSQYNTVQDDITCISTNNELQILDLNFNGSLYKQYQFSNLFEIPQQYSIFDDLIMPQMDNANNDETNKSIQVTTTLTYGQKSTGKSELIGSLFENVKSQQSLISLTLDKVFCDQDEDEQSNKEVYISCYEVFLETLTDLFDETNEQFTTENDATWLKVQSQQQAQQQLRNVFLNRKQIVDENGLSYSQSHLIVNVKVQDSTSENGGQMFSFIDLVGFDQNFTQKIMEGDSFGIHNQSAVQQAENGMINDSKLQDLISECNDNNLFSLRNLLLAIENDNDHEIQQVLNETTLARVVFAKLLQSQNFYVIGMVNEGQSNFNESLNTLEFCTKFQQALTPQTTITDENHNVLFSLGGGDENLMTTECAVAALPQEVSAYLETNPNANQQDQMSKFYNNNRSIAHSRVHLNNNHQNQTNISINRTALNKSNVSMNSTKMLSYLEKFFIKKQEDQVYGQAPPVLNGANSKQKKIVTVQSRNQPRMFKDNAIKVHQDFRMETSQQQYSQVIQQKQQQPILRYPRPPSERSTGFATNTQLTHMRKYSQDLNMKKMGEEEKTFSELNLLEQEIKEKTENQQRLFSIENFSKIQGKSKFDSSFLSTYIIHGGETPRTMAQGRQVLQKQRSTILIQNNNRISSSNESSSQVTPSTQKLPPKYTQRQQDLLSKQKEEQQQNPLAQHFIQSVIRESMKAVQVQMKDFNDFFLKDKSLEGCFPCNNNNGGALPSDPKQFSDIFQQKKQKFFDLDKVLREIEQKEIRQQTLISIRDSHPSHHKKNNKSVSILNTLNKQPLQQFNNIEPPRQIQIAKQQLKRGQSIANLGKENLSSLQQQQQQKQAFDYKQGSRQEFESLNQLTFPLSTYTLQMTQDRGNMPQQLQDSRVLSELLNIINNSVDTKRNIQQRTFNQ